MGEPKTPREIIAFQLPGARGLDVEWADAIIEDLREAGFKILPREPTEAMHEAGGSIVSARAWRTMWDAADPSSLPCTTERKDG